MLQTRYLNLNNGSRLKKLVSCNISTLNLIFLSSSLDIGSEYLFTLTDTLTIYHDIWLLDLPDNGSNHCDGNQFQNWPKYLEEICSSFNNVILVGHSFSTYVILMSYFQILILKDI